MVSESTSHEGFAAFYADEHTRLVTSVLLATGDAEIARDATDEAFVRALNAWSRVGSMDSAVGWTYRVAINVVRRKERRRALEQRLLRRHVRQELMPAPAGEAWEIVRALPPRQRTAVVLRFVADMTEAQIAEVMGVSRSTVSNTLADARQTLARELADHDHATGDRHG